MTPVYLQRVVAYGEAERANVAITVLPLICIDLIDDAALAVGRYV